MQPRLVMGLGGTVDYEIDWDPAVLEGLVERYGITPDELDDSVPVVDERSLVRSVLGFVAAGRGGERFVSDSAVLERFSARFPRRVTLGGTPVRAAMAMLALGVRSTVHLVSVDDHVRRLLPAEIGYVCSAERDTTDPHLIVQFAAGARVRVGEVTLVASHPNRLIYANDPPNRELVLSEELGPLLADADVFVVSGFNVIQEPEVLSDRLRRVRELTRVVPSHGVVLYEDSGFHRPELTAEVRDRLADAVDVWSMNEEELQAYLARPVDLLDVADLAAALAEVHRIVPAATLVVHTRFHSVARGPQAARWAEALRGGITMATTRYRCGDDFTAADYAATAGLPPHPDGARVARSLPSASEVPVVCVPAFLLDVDRPTTIGLGDTFVGGFVAALASEVGHGRGATTVEAPVTSPG